MKYMPTFDQVMVVDLGLKCQSGLFIDLLINASLWADKITVDDEDYYFLDYGKIISEIPSVVNSKPRITQIVKDLRKSKVIKTITKSRSNWFKVDSDLVKYWCKNNKDSSYKIMVEAFLALSKKSAPIVQETERSGNGTFRKRNDKGGNRSGNGTVIVQETESIHQLSNTPTNNTPTNDIFDFWVSCMEKTKRTRLTDERRKKIKARLVNYSVDEIKQAILNCSKNHFHVENGHTDLVLICQSDTKLERFRDMIPRGRPKSGVRNFDNVISPAAFAGGELEQVNF